ncbi:LptF/LptG family permease [candidate division KSB1 bacterium]|nr:LptF/LptG family permease [candidate division KSB1 bacterium]
MSILSRYILRQHIGPFFFSFSIISLIWILNLLFKELNRFLSKGLPIHLIIEFFVLSLGWIVALSVPMATLTASLMVYGRMSGDNEITAMKATGVSFLRILRPTLFASILLAMGLVWFNNNVLPHSNHRLSMLMRYMANKKPAMRIEPGVWFDDLTNISMLVADKVDSGNVSIVREVMINDYSDLHAISTINADSGRIWANEKTGILEIRLFKGEIQSISLNSMKEFKRLQFQDYLIRINVADMFNQQRPDSKRRSDREMSAQEMLAEVHENEKKYAAKKQHIQELVGREFNKLFGTSFGLPMPATNDSLEILSDDAGEPAKVKVPPHFIKDPEQLNLPPRKIIEIPPIKKAYLNQKEVLTSLRVDMNGMQSYKRRNDKLMVEVHKKYSIPFACIIFVLVGMSLGTMSRSGGIGMSLGISLFFFILHWALIIAGEDLADRGLVSPFLSMWLANIIVGVASLVLLYLLTNETPVSEFIKHNWLKFLGIGFLIEWIQKKYLQRNDFAAM